LAFLPLVRIEGINRAWSPVVDEDQVITVAESRFHARCAPKRLTRGPWGAVFRNRLRSALESAATTTTAEARRDPVQFALGGTVKSMPADNTPAAAEQLPAGANAGADQGQPGARLVRPRYRLVALIGAVKRMSYLLQGNVRQYRALVARLQDPAVSFPILDDPVAHGDLLGEAERLLHNVVTAMSTRVNQQRRFMAAYFSDDPVLMQEYRDRIASDFTASAEAAFLKGLRNYIAHMQLPVAQSQEAYTARSVRISFILSAAPLLEWDGWNADTRAWIVGHGRDVPIADIVDTYARVADEFDRWLADRIGVKYRADRSLPTGR